MPNKINWGEAKNALFELDGGGAIIIRMFADYVQVLHSKTITEEPHPTVQNAKVVGFDDTMGQWCAMKINRIFFDDFAASTKMGHGKRDVLHVIDKALRSQPGSFGRGKAPFTALRKLLDAITDAGGKQGVQQTAPEAEAA